MKLVYFVIHEVSVNSVTFINGCINSHCHFLKIMTLVQCKIDANFLFFIQKGGCSDLRVLISILSGG